MFEWLEGIEDYFNQVGASLSTILTDLQTLIDNLNAYITFSTYYIFGSGIAIIVLLIMCASLLSGQAKILKQNNYIIQMLESDSEEGEEKDGEYS